MIEMHFQDENGEWFVRREEINGVIQKQHLVAKAANYTEATKNPEDCICAHWIKVDDKWVEQNGRTLIANCPCCDGIQLLVWEECKCPDGAHRPKVTMPPPNALKRVRYIDTVEPIV